MLLFFLHHVCLALSPAIQLPRGSHAFPLSPASDAVSLCSAVLSAALLSYGFVLRLVVCATEGWSGSVQQHYFEQIFELSTCPDIAKKKEETRLTASLTLESSQLTSDSFSFHDARFFEFIFILDSFLSFGLHHGRLCITSFFFFCALFCSLFKALRKVLPLSCG